MFGRRRKNESLGLPQSDARCRPKTWGWLATFGLALVAAVASQLPALAAVSWSHDYGFSFATLQHMTGDGMITLVYVSTPVQVGLLFWFARLRSSSAVEYLALTLPRKRDMPVLLLSAAVLVAASDGLSWLLGKNLVTSFQQAIYRSAASAGAQVWLWLAVVIVAPIGEEILFRGFLFRGWQRSSGDAWIAIGATAVLWAIVHVQYDPLVIGEILVAGLVLGWVRWRSRSTISTILLHSLLNAGGMAETYFQLRG
jgi:uncharacterized protein